MQPLLSVLAVAGAVEAADTSHCHEQPTRRGPAAKRTMPRNVVTMVKERHCSRPNIAASVATRKEADVDATDRSWHQTGGQLQSDRASRSGELSTSVRVANVFRVWV